MAIVSRSTLFGLALALLGMSCSLAPPPAPATPLPIPTPTPLPSAEVLIQRAADRLGSVRSADIDVKITDGAIALTSGITVDAFSATFLKPDRLRLKATTVVFGATINLEVIKVGSQLYLLNPLSQQWQALPAGSTPLEQLDPLAAANVFKQAKDLTRVGRVTLNGVDTWQIRGTIPPEALVPLIGAQLGDAAIVAEIWTGVQDDLPRQIRLEIPSGGKTQTATIVLSGFDRPVTIEAPK